MSDALNQTLSFPRSDPIRKMFMEGKALELAAYKLARIQSAKSGAGPRRLIRNEDHSRIFEADDPLNHDLENPPALFDLARSVGMSHSKLNAGFR